MPEVTSAAVERLIPDIHDAALQPEMWPEVVGRLCTAFGAAGGELINAGIALNQRWVLYNFPELPIQNYVTRHAARDAVVPAIMAQAAGRPIAFRIRDIPEVMGTPLYDDVVVPMGMSSMCLAFLGNVAGLGFELVALGRSSRQRPFERRTVEGLARLTPHLRSAGIVQMRLEQAGEPFRAVLDGLAGAVVVLDRLGRLLFANRAAERLLRERDGIHLEGGRLAAATAATTARLQAAVERAIASQRAAGNTPGEDLALPRPSGKAPLAVHVAPLGRCNPDWVGGLRTIVGVFIDDPERLAPTSAHRLQAVYGLTPAEARVALALAEGLSPAEIGERLGTQPKTVRTQLEAVFAKLGVRRQAQAVQRVLAVARSFASEDPEA